MSDVITDVTAELVDLLNEQLTASGVETQYTAEELTFGTPELFDADTIDLNNPTARNSRVTVTVIDEELEEGVEPQEYTLHYNRLSLAHLFGLKANNAALDGSDEFVSTHDALAALAAYYKVPLTIADVEDEVIDEDGNGVKTIVVTATAESLGFFGEGVFTVPAPVDPVDP